MPDKQKKFFSVEPLNVDNFISVNKLQEITNPIFFTGNNVPTSDGLLSNEIFGITKADRSNIFAYISFGNEWFINPIMYKLWSKMDSKLVDCVYGNGKFKINKEGKLENDPNGDTGISFLKANFNKVKFAPNDSIIRNANIKFFNKYRDRVFIRNFIVIPAFYRDVNTTDRYVGVGDINKLYNSLLIAAKSLKEYNEYGLEIHDSIKGRMEDTMVQLYDYFTSESIAGKLGLMRFSGLSKTADYSSRLVMSAPNLKVENMDDLLVDVDHAAVPMTSIIANFFPYMVVYIRNFFMTEFQNKPYFDVQYKGELVKIKPRDYRITFSDEVIEHELDNFVHGFSDRFKVIEVLADANEYHIDKFNLKFSGYYIKPGEAIEKDKIDPSDLMPIQERYMTWCDLFYMGAVEVTRDKMVLITRYPIDSCYNQFPLKVNVTSTIKTEPMVVGMTLYKHYPYIRKEDIGKNTSNKFIDTVSISNVYLESIDGDYKPSLL